MEIKVTMKIKDVEITLTLAELRTLKNELNGLFSVYHYPFYYRQESPLVTFYKYSDSTVEKGEF